MIRTNAILVFLVVTTAIVSLQCGHTYNNDIEDYIEQIATDGPEVKWEAFKRLFAGGKDAIPVLLKYGLDKRITHLSLCINPLGSSSPSEEETRQTVGIICLYLIESIKTGVMLHSSKPYILHPEQRPEARRDYWVTRDKYEAENQKRAYEAYLKWWASVKDNKIFTRDLAEIVPWDDYLKDNSLSLGLICGIVSASDILGTQDTEEVVKKLEDTNPHIRRLAIKSLGRLKARDSAHEIIKRINDTHPRVRVTAIRIFKYWKVKEAVPAIAERLEDEDARVRQEAIKALHELEAKETLPEIVKRIDDNDLKVCLSAIEQVGIWGDKEVIPLITKKLEDADAPVRWYAIEALGKLGAQEAILQIMTMLNDTHSGVRAEAVEALGELDAQEALPEIIKRLDDELFVEQNAIGAIAKLDEQEKKSVPELLKRLKSNNERTRWTALILLGRLKVREAIPQIIGALNDADNRNRTRALSTLKGLDAKEAIPAIIKCLKDEHENVRAWARNVLEEWGVNTDEK